LFLARRVQRQDGLLIDCLEGHKAHVSPRGRLTNGRSIGGIVFLALDVGLDVLRRHQAHVVAERAQLAAPVVRTTAGLHRHHTRALPGKELDHLGAAQLFAQDGSALLISTMHLNHIFGQIQADGCNLHGGRSFFVQVDEKNTATLAQRCRYWGGSVHSIGPHAPAPDQGRGWLARPAFMDAGSSPA
jgi:hypothetical protein